MTVVFLALLTGAGLGFVSSTPLGPINLLVAQWMRDDRRRDAILFVAGVIVADVAVAALALQGLLQAHLSTEILRGIGLGGGSLFLLLGLWGIVRGSSGPLLAVAAPDRRWHFFSGTLFCGLNPGFYLFWIFGSTLLLSEGDVHAVTAGSYLAGVILGDILWFTFFAWFVHSVGHKAREGMWRWGSNLLMVAFGLIAIWGAWYGNFNLE